MTSRSPRLARALLLFAAAVGGCGGETGPEGSGLAEASLLKSQFPGQAEKVLGGVGRFTESGGQLVLEADGARSGSLGVALPRRGPSGVVLRTMGGLEVRVVESGMEGDAVLVERAVAYSRAGGISYWAAVPGGGAGRGGVEEWLYFGAGVASANEPVATWEVDGATVQQRGEAVMVLDAGGAARLRVTAPEAYAAGGRRIDARLEGDGRRIALFVEATREAVLVDPRWVPATDMLVPHVAHTASLLPDGDVLIVGGSSSSLYSDPERYHPATDSWSPVPPAGHNHVFHTATVLLDGRVLVVGGQESAGVVSANAEIYDPATDAWTAASSLSTARRSHSATPLHDGRVLVAGGETNGDDAVYLTSTEIYDPALDTWAQAAPLSLAHSEHAATLLDDGRVLVTGGWDGIGGTVAAEIYDPVTDAWTAASSMLTPRFGHTSTRLPDGRVLVAVGGGATAGEYDASVEVYDPATNTWVPPVRAVGRFYSTATPLAGGQVLLAGGWAAGATATAELYDPETSSVAPVAALTTPRYLHTATLLGDGNVLVAGGIDGAAGNLATAEIFRLKEPIGVPCDGGGACVSGHCVDGVCCNTECGGGDPADCQTCSLMMGASTDGLCAPLQAATSCRAAVGSCDVAEVCDGTATACPEDAAEPDGTPCQDGVCAEGLCIPDGSGGGGGAGGSGGAGGGGSGGMLPPGDSDVIGHIAGDEELEGGTICGCRVAGDPAPPLRDGVAVTALAAAAMVGRRWHRRDRGRAGRRSTAAPR